MILSYEVANFVIGQANRDEQVSERFMTQLSPRLYRPLGVSQQACLLHMLGVRACLWGPTPSQFLGGAYLGSSI